MPNKTTVSVDIDVESIMAQYGGYTDQIIKEIAKQATRLARNTTAFEDQTGYLRSKIKNRESKFEGADGLKGRLVIAEAPHAHLVEDGHAITMSKNGEIIGHVRPYPFMGPAEDAVLSQVDQIAYGVMNGVTVKIGVPNG